jgi:hypothetical protein
VAAWQAEELPAAGRREALESRVRLLEAELRNLTNALAGGAHLASVQGAIEARERERGELLAQLEHLDGMARLSAPDPEALRRRLTDWQGLLEREPVQARQILKKLLEGRLAFAPFDKAGDVGYQIRGQATYGRLLSGVISVVPPGGTDSEWRAMLAFTLNAVAVIS